MQLSRITPQHEIIWCNDVKGDTVLVPASQLAFFLIDLPTKSRSQAQKLAGFALEEELSEDIDDLHFAVNPYQGQWLVAVVENKLMQLWLVELQQQEIKPKRLIPDVIAMDGNVCILEEPHQILVKQLTSLDKSEQETATTTEDGKSPQVNATTDTSTKQAPLKNPNKPFIACGISTPFLQPLLDYWNVNIDNLNCFHSDNYGQLLESNLKIDNHSINLLQGDYAESNSILELAQPWLISFVLLCFILLSYTFVTWKNNQELEHQINLSSQDNIRLFRQTFPNIQRIINPRAQAEVRFKEIQKNQQRNAGSLIQLLNMIIPTLINHANVALESVRYRNFNILLQLNAVNVRTLEQLIQELKQNAQLNIRVESLGQQEDGKAKSRIQISKKL